MLQQTQVTTALPYYQRFIEHFPDLPALARATEDEVLHLWSGLGYYARARNLHRAARQVVAEYGGELPSDLARLQALPGIGRSTAGAILCFSADQRHPILDGNVKRVLCRHRAVAGWPGTAAVQQVLWALADELTPGARVADYTQAIMDLGATVCTRARPRCAQCPVATDCRARGDGRQGEFPASRPRRDLPVRQVTFLVLRNPRGEVLLRRRPPTGVWGGLWGFPECGPGDSPVRWCRDQLGLRIGRPQFGDVVRHSFSHFHLDITPAVAEVAKTGWAIQDDAGSRWVDPDDPPSVGLAAPVNRLIQLLRNPT